MNRNRIHRTRSNSNSQFFIGRLETDLDERAAYIESVCRTLIESRGGPVDEFQSLNWRSLPDPEPVWFYDICGDGEMLPWYVMSAQGRNWCRLVEAAYRRALRMGLKDAGPNARRPFVFSSSLSPNEGRGSP